MLSLFWLCTFQPSWGVLWFTIVPCLRLNSKILGDCATLTNVFIQYTMPASSNRVNVNSVHKYFRSSLIFLLKLLVIVTIYFVSLKSLQIYTVYIFLSEDKGQHLSYFSLSFDSVLYYITTIMHLEGIYGNTYGEVSW